VSIQPFEKQAIRHIACGYYHSLAIGANNTLWGWGLGTDFQLCNGTDSVIYYPTSLEKDNPLFGKVIEKVVSGSAHTLCIVH